ncbi:hypothetical protein HN51_070057 [Arachis hypogaea]
MVIFNKCLHMLMIVDNEEFYEQERPLSLKDIRSLIIILRQPTLQAENGAISDRTPECWKDFPCILSYDPNLRLALWPSAEAA